MTFLNPLVLFGLVAAAIPLLIHLFNFRRPKKIDFSSLVFLRELQQTTMQRVRIKQWLLLLLRTLALACLILAFARPTLEGPIVQSIGGDGESATVIVIDNSLSMTVRNENGMLLSQAKSMAGELIELLKSGDQIAILTTADAETRDQRWHKTRTAASDRLSEIDPGFAVRNLGDRVAEAIALALETAYVNREVFVFSDFQKSTIGRGLDVDASNVVPVRLVKMGADGKTNMAIESVRVLSQIIERNQPVKVEAVVANYGSRPATIVAGIYLNGERVGQATSEVSFRAREPITFSITPRSAGWLSGSVRIEDDGFEFDNERFFTVSVPETRKILVVRGSGFKSGYLDVALASGLSPGRTRFDVKTIPVNRLSSADPSQSDVIVLAGVDKFSSGEISLLEQFASAGGGLFVLPPERLDESNINDLLGRIGGGRLEAIRGDQNNVPLAVFGGADTDHILFDGVFDSPQAGVGPQLEETEVFRFAEYRPGGTLEQTIIRLSTAQPFLQEFRHGRGRTLLMAAVPDPAWSDLPLRGLFVPLVYRSLHYLASGESSAGEAVTVGVNREIRLSNSGGDPVSVSTQEGEFAPSQRRVFGGTLVTLGQELARPGVVEVRTGDRLARMLAANVDSTEFDLTVADAGEAATTLAGSSQVDIEVLPASDLGPDRFASAVSELRTGVELWNVFLVLALTFLLAEMVVARYWRPEAAPA